MSRGRKPKPKLNTIIFIKECVKKVYELNEDGSHKNKTQIVRCSKRTNYKKDSNESRNNSSLFSEQTDDAEFCDIDDNLFFHDDRDNHFFSDDRDNLFDI